jgi:comEA protein
VINVATGGRISLNTALAPATGALVDVNAATATELEALPGIGARTAAAIVDYREKNGPFKKVEELMNVKGIGEKSFLRLKPLVTVTPPKATRPATSSTPSQG